MKIKAIVAVSMNGVIGNTKSNALPWKNKYSQDMKFFRQMTAGGTVIMGRKTFESIGKPLPKRRNIVISRNSTRLHEGIEMAPSLSQAIEMVDEPIKAAAEIKDNKLVDQTLPDCPITWIIGGGTIYAESMAYVDEIYVTLIPETIIDSDSVYFTWINPEFKIVETLTLTDETKVSPDLTVLHYVRERL